MPGGIAGISGWKEPGNKKNPLKNSFFSDWFIKQIDKSISENQDFQESRSGVFHPSSLGNTCDRYLYLYYNGLFTQQSIEPRVRRIFDHGNSTEARYQKYFEHMKVLRGREVPAKYDNPPISGRADFKLEFPEMGHLLVELKTINANGFSRLTVPKPEHSIQLQTYLNILDVPQGFVLYESKDTQSMKAFLIKKSDQQWEEIVNRCIRIMGMTEVPKMETVEKVHDKWCQCREFLDEIS